MKIEELKKEKAWSEWVEDMTAHEYKRIDALYGLEYDEVNHAYYSYLTAEELLNFRFRAETEYGITSDPNEAIVWTNE